MLIAENFAFSSAPSNPSDDSVDNLIKLKIKSRRSSMGIPRGEDSSSALQPQIIPQPINPYEWRYFSSTPEQFYCFLDTTYIEELIVHFKGLLEYDIEQQPAFKAVDKVSLKKKLLSLLKKLTLHLKNIPWELTHFKAFKEEIWDEQLPYVSQEFTLFKRLVEEQCNKLSKKYKRELLLTSAPAHKSSYTASTGGFFAAAMNCIPFRGQREPSITRGNSNEMVQSGIANENEWEDSPPGKSANIDQNKSLTVETRYGSLSGDTKGNSTVPASSDPVIQSPVNASSPLAEDPVSPTPIQADKFKTISQFLERRASAGSARTPIKPSSPLESMVQLAAENGSASAASPEIVLPRRTSNAQKSSADEENNKENGSYASEIPSLTVKQDESLLASPAQMPEANNNERSQIPKRALPPPLPPRRGNVRPTQYSGGTYKAGVNGAVGIQGKHDPIDSSALPQRTHSSLNSSGTPDIKTGAEFNGVPVQTTLGEQQDPDVAKKKKKFFWIIKPLVGLVAVATIMYLYIHYYGDRKSNRISSVHPQAL